MILKSFFRKNNTRIYFMLLILIISVIISIKELSLYNTSIIEKTYVDKSIIYIELEHEVDDSLNEIKKIKKIKDGLVLEYKEGLIDKKVLSIYELNNQVLVYPDNDNRYSLTDNEMIIEIPKEDYIVYKDDISNNTLKFNYLEKDYSFNLKDIKENNSKIEIYISKEKFAELRNMNNKKIYIISASSEDDENDIIKKLHKKNMNSMILTSEKASDYNARSELEKYINILNIASVLFCVIFLLVVIVINKNIISDLKKDILLEHRMGFNKFQIKKNIIVRLISLHLLVFGVSIFIQTIAGIILNYIDKQIINVVMFLLVYCLISDLLLVLIAKYKSNL